MLTEATKKVDILIEALPYIKRFSGKILVVKFGGSVPGEVVVNRSMLEDITFMNHVGMHPIIVHGAGPSISQKMKEANLEVKFVDGIRVTDKATLDIVTSVLSEVNKNIVSGLKELGNEAKGFVGKNGELIMAKKKSNTKDIGFVGEVTKIDKKLLSGLLNAKIIPVVAPLGVGEDGELYNLNADTVAAEIAISMSAEKMVLLTNVRGIMRDMEKQDTLISSVNIPELKSLIDKNIIHSGMIPKVGACMKAAEHGVQKTHIIDSRIPHALLLEVYTDKGIGTEIVKK